MGHTKSEILEHRREELAIFDRSLEVLLEFKESNPDDYELLERVLKMEESIYAAVKAVKKIKIPQTYYYYHALGRLIKLQAEHKLVEPYKGKEEISRKIKRMRQAMRKSKKMGSLTPTRLAELRKWDLLYAAYYHKILPEAVKPPIRRKRSKRYFTEDKYIAFQKGIRALYHGGITDTTQLKHKRPKLHSYISHGLGINHFSFLAELFFEFSRTGRIPATEATARALPHSEVIDKYYGGDYSRVVNEWQPYFEENKVPLQEFKIHAAGKFGVPPGVLEKTDSMLDMGGIIFLFRDYPKQRKRLSTVFERVETGLYHWYITLLKNPRAVMARGEYTFENALKKAEECSELLIAEEGPIVRRRRKVEEVGYEGFREPYKVSLPESKAVY